MNETYQDIVDRYQNHATNVDYKTIFKSFFFLINAVKFYCNVIPTDILQQISSRTKILSDTIPCLIMVNLINGNGCNKKDSELRKICFAKANNNLCEVRKFFLLLNFFNIINIVTVQKYLSRIETLDEMLRNCCFNR